MQKEQLKNDYQKGLTGKEIARKYGLKLSTVYKYLHQLNTKMRDSKFKKGFNVWETLDEKKKIKWKKKLSERMSKYNPMKNVDVQKRRSIDERRRRGATGRLTHREKRLLIKEVGKCEICGIKYPLTVHHKDGNRYNNRRDNLQVLCFNCHYDKEYGGRKYAQKKPR